MAPGTASHAGLEGLVASRFKSPQECLYHHARQVDVDSTSIPPSGSNNTQWKCGVNGGGDGINAPTSSFLQWSNDNGSTWNNFPKIKGMCYAPSPIGSNSIGQMSAPALGDWFWDGYLHNNNWVPNWCQLWENSTNIHNHPTARADLDAIQDLGCNTIRVYSMITNQLNSAGSAIDFNQTFTHEQFLVSCNQRGISVLVEIPLPKELYIGANPVISENDWKTEVINTVKETSQYPAVMGYIIQNEFNSNPFCVPKNASGLPSDGGNSQTVDNYWSQVEVFAKLVKDNCSTPKLVGWSGLENPCVASLQCQTYLENCTSIDFYGINTYHDVATILEPNPLIASVGYNYLQGTALKPIICTEFGWSATGRRNPNLLPPDLYAAANIYEDDLTISIVVTQLNKWLLGAFGSSIILGGCFFEFCDEWWNPGTPGDYVVTNSNSWTLWGGQATHDPNGNGWWDNVSFGLYKMTIPNNAATTTNGCPIIYGIGPYFGPMIGDTSGQNPIKWSISKDLVPRAPIHDALKTFYQSLD